MPTLRSVAPVLHCADLACIRDMLVEQLGFVVTGSAGNPPSWASLARDSVELMLVAASAPAHPRDWAAYVHVTGVDALYEEFERNGARFKGPPENQPYRSRDFDVILPDGRSLVFGESIREESPQR